MLLLAATLAACSSENTIDNGVPEQPVVPQSFHVSIDLSLPVMETASRAAEDYDDGRSVIYENYIDIDNGNYRFYAFSLDNHYIATLNIEDMYVRETPDTKCKTYQILANFDEDPGPDFKIVALANWPTYFSDTYPQLMTHNLLIDEFMGDVTANFNVDPLRAPAADNLIPMFGVKEFRDIDFSEVRSWLGTLHMLRAISKVEVSISPSASPMIHFQSLKLHNYYTVGVAMPRLSQYVQADYVNSGFAIDYLRPATMRPAVANPRQTELDLTPALVDDKVTFYLPEIRLTENYSLLGVPYDYTSRTRMSATFTMEGNDSFDSSHTYDIEFKFYDPAQALKAGATQYDYFDIMRNYFYRFSIKSLSGADVNIYADVVPYTEVTLRPAFGFPLGGDPEPEPPIGCGCIENGGTCTCSPDCGCCNH